MARREKKSDPEPSRASWDSSQIVPHREASRGVERIYFSAGDLFSTSIMLMEKRSDITSHVHILTITIWRIWQSQSVSTRKCTKQNDSLRITWVVSKRIRRYMFGLLIARQLAAMARDSISNDRSLLFSRHSRLFKDLGRFVWVLTTGTSVCCTSVVWIFRNFIIVVIFRSFRPFSTSSAGLVNSILLNHWK